MPLAAGPSLTLMGPRLFENQNQLHKMRGRNARGERKHFGVN